MDCGLPMFGEDPVFTSFPSDTTVNVDPGGCNAIVTYATPTFDDNCPGTTLASTGPSSGSAFPLGTTAVTFTVTNTSGQSISRTLNITVADNQAPVAPSSCDTIIIVDAGIGSTSAQITYDTPVFTDNCGSVITTLTSGPVSGTTQDLGSYEIIHTAVDPSGNETSCTFVILVLDVNESTTSCGILEVKDTITALLEFNQAVARDSVVRSLSDDFSPGQLSPYGLILSLVEVALNIEIPDFVAQLLGGGGGLNIGFFSLNAGLSPGIDFDYGLYNEILATDSANININYPLRMCIGHPQDKFFGCNDTITLTSSSDVLSNANLEVDPGTISTEIGFFFRNISFELSAFIEASACIGIPNIFNGDCIGYELSYDETFVIFDFTDEIISLFPDGGFRDFLENGTDIPIIVTCDEIFQSGVGWDDFAQCATDFGVDSFVDDIIDGIESAAGPLGALDGVTYDASTDVVTVELPPSASVIPVPIPEFGFGFGRLNARDLSNTTSVVGNQLQRTARDDNFTNFRLDIFSFLDYIIWALSAGTSELPPCVSIGTTIDLGCGLLQLDIADLNTTLINNLEGDYTFDPNLMVDGLDLGIPMDWTVLNDVGTVVSSGSGSSITGFEIGNSIELVITDGQTDPFANSVNADLEGELGITTTKELDFGFGILFLQFSIAGETIFGGIGKDPLFTVTLDETIIQDSTFTLPTLDASFDFNLVPDDIPPVLVCKDTAVILDQWGMAFLTPEMVYDSLNSFDLPIGGTGVIELISVEPDTLTCQDIGDVTVTLTATDGNCNFSTCTATVNVSDIDPPQMACENITIYLDSMEMMSITTDDVKIGVVDNCRSAELSLDQDQFGCDDLLDVLGAPQIVTLTAVDLGGNVKSCMSEVTVLDTIAPRVFCPDTAQVRSTDPGVCTYTNGPIEFAPTFLDEDCFVTLTYEVSKSGVVIGTGNDTISGFVFPLDTSIVTYTYCDVSNNCTSCSFEVVVQDTEPPVVNCPADVTISTNDDGLNDYNCTTNYSWTHPTPTDNCSIVFYEVKYTNPDSSMSTEDLLSRLNNNNLSETRVFELGTTTVSYLVRDTMDNVDSCSFTVTVVDDEAPMAICPADIIINLGPGECERIVNFALEGIDNCAVDTITASPESGSIFMRGTTTVTIVVTDEAGLQDSCTFDIIVNEFQPSSNSLACNDLVNVSLDVDCQAEITADLILEGNDYGCYDDFVITVSDANGPIPGSPIVTTDHIGQTLTVTVLDTISGNSCWGLILVEDKLSPEIECPADTIISCNTPTGPDVLGFPILLSCEPGGVTTSFEDVVTENDRCNDPRLEISRTWTVVDSEGNATVCMQLISMLPFDLNQVVFPRDTVLDCGLVSADPSVLSSDSVGYPSVDGRPIRLGAYCAVTINVTDEIFDDCLGGYDLIRTWKVRSRCLPTGPDNPLEYQQVIEVADQTGPTIAGPTAVTISTDVWRCAADWEIPALLLEDNCSSVASLDIISPVGEVVYDVASQRRFINDIPPGQYDIILVASDHCYNQTRDTIELTVVDDVPPTTICDQQTTVSLTTTQNINSDNLGITKVEAASFDDGSFDNCSAQIWFKAIRMDEFNSNGNNKNGEEVRLGDWASIDCEGANGDDDLRVFPPWYQGNQSYFDDYVKVCCADIENGPVMVVFRVFDVDPEPFTFGRQFPGLVPAGENPNDYNGVLPEFMAEGGALYGHYSDCMVELTVQDKQAPFVEAPPSITVTCDFWFEFDPDNPNDYTDALDAVFGKVVEGSADPAGRDSIIVRDRVCTAHPRFTEFAPTTIFDDPCYDDQYDIFWGIDGFALDNCFINLEQTIIPDLHCGRGNILRRWQATDADGNHSNIATQQITIIDCKEFYVPTACWRFTPQDVGSCDLVNLGNGLENRIKLIEWPCNVDLNSCQGGADGNDVFKPENLDVSFEEDRRPRLDDDNCNMLTSTYTDEVFTFVDSACLKIFRSWTVVDWCLFEDFENGVYTGEWEWHWLQIIKLSNEEGPVFGQCEFAACGFGDSTNTQGDQCVGIVEIRPDITDDCTPVNELRVDYKLDLFNDGDYDLLGYSDTYTNGYPFPNPQGLPVRQFPAADANANGTYPIGTHRILWGVEDVCGNSNVCEYTFEIEDCKPPTAYCEVGISTIPMPPGAGAFVDIWASDFNLGSEDNCTAPEDLIFSFSNDPNDLSRRLTCSDAGAPLNYTIYVWDEAGNYATCLVSVVLNNCGGNGPFMVTGEIRDIANREVEDVLVRLNGSMNTQEATTDVAGLFNFLNLQAGQNIQLTPEKNIDHRNGVTTFDLVLMSKHILGVEPLDSPYKIIAADVNRSGSVTTFDLVQIRRLILYIDNEFSSNTSWRFIDSDYLFSDPQNPFASTFPEYYSVNGLSQDEVADFKAVKIGDVNISASPNSLVGSEARNFSDELVFTVDDQLLIAGEDYQINFYASDMESMLGYQFTLNFNPELLTLTDVEAGSLPNLDAGNFGLSLLDRGVLTTSWNRSEGVVDSTKLQELKKEQVAFSLKLRPLENVRVSEALSLSSDYTQAEAYRWLDGQEVELLDVQLAFKEGVPSPENSAFALLQNQPNPFMEETKIGFVLPEDTEASLEIYDVSGRMLKLIEGDFIKGYNEVLVRRSELSGSGILFYRLKAAGHEATKRMIVLE
ncbi:MAG: HYR domain-containing protein [Bacteroidota bacterium]